MSGAYAIVDIPKSLPIHGMALTSTGRKIEHKKADDMGVFLCFLAYL